MSCILLLLGIVYALRIPKLIRSTAAEYPSCDPSVHAAWRAKELASIYVFLVATWGQSVVFFVIGIAIGLANVNNPEAIRSATTNLTIAELAVFLGGIIWAAVLGSQSGKLKKQLGLPVQLPPSYYPRPGQAVIQPAPPITQVPDAIEPTISPEPPSDQ